MNACSTGRPAGVAWVPGELSHPAGPVASSAPRAVPSALALSSGWTRAAIAGTDSCRAVTSACGAVNAACGWRERALTVDHAARSRVRTTDPVVRAANDRVRPGATVTDGSVAPA